MAQSLFDIMPKTSVCDLLSTLANTNGCNYHIKWNGESDTDPDGEYYEEQEQFCHWTKIPPAIKNVLYQNGKRIEWTTGATFILVDL